MKTLFLIKFGKPVPPAVSSSDPICPWGRPQSTGWVGWEYKSLQHNKTIALLSGQKITWDRSLAKASLENAGWHGWLETKAATTCCSQHGRPPTTETEADWDWEGPATCTTCTAGHHAAELAAARSTRLNRLRRALYWRPAVQEVALSCDALLLCGEHQDSKHSVLSQSPFLKFLFCQN